jgi:N-acetyl-gamma-glutamylphosphate reductase
MQVAAVAAATVQAVLVAAVLEMQQEQPTAEVVEAAALLLVSVEQAAAGLLLSLTLALKEAQAAQLHQAVETLFTHLQLVELLRRKQYVES